MANEYSFLKDELAVVEIRKHKWIESEKRGYEVGFATAAIDWIKKYGSTWKQFRFPGTSPHALSEKRQHRRFPVQFPVQLSCDTTRFSCETKDVSLIGLSCSLPESLPPDATADVTILIKGKNRPKSRFQFKSRISRIHQPVGQKGYHVFLPFNEEVRDYLRANAEILNNVSLS